MNRISRYCATLAVTVALFVTSVSIAQAADPEVSVNQVAEQIDAVAPVVEVAKTVDLGEFFIADDVANSIAIPTDADDPVTLTSTDPAAPELSISLPSLSGTEEARRALDGTIVYTSDEDVSLAVQPLKDGSARFLSVLESKDSPERIEYRFEGNQLTLQDNGSVLIHSQEALTGTIDTPWAYDANGTAVPTHFEINGNTLVQVIEHSSGDFAYPISADPLVRYWWGYQLQMNNSQTNKIVKVIAAGAGAAGVASALAAAGVISSPGAIPTGIAAAVGFFGAAALDLCNWNDRGVNLNLTWNGWATCTAR